MEFKKKNPVIFIVAGKANCGKDTTCELMNNNIKLKGLKSTNLQFSSYIKTYAKTISGWDGSEETKPRSLLQQLGTDIIRNEIDNNFFINRIIGDIKVYSYYFDVITISDARFPEEIESIKNNFEKVVRIKVERPGFVNKLTDKERKHATETSLDEYSSYDYYVVNDGSIDDLNEKIKNILNEVLKNEKIN